MKRKWFYILFILSALSSCLESPVMTTGIVNGKEKPTVLTVQEDPFSDGGGNLVFQGEITSKGKAEIIKKGFYWSTVSNNPGDKDNIIILSDTSAGIFSGELKGASGENTYYWRAFAQNSFGCDSGEVQSCHTPAIWMAKTDFPPDKRWRGAVFMLNNRIYMTCGITDVGLNMPVDLWEYNIASDQWNQTLIMSFIGAARVYPSVFTIGNIAYVGMGLQSYTVAPFKDLYQFSADFRKWGQITIPDNFDERYKAVAFSLNGNGYIIGGLSSNDAELNDVWQYNPNGDVWEQKNNFPVNLYGGISIYDNNRAFAGFGENSESTRTLWEYDQAADKWNEFAKLPDEETTAISSGVIVKNTIYVVDGKYSIWALNMSDTTWTKKSDLPSDFLQETGGVGGQTLLTTDSSDSIYVGLGLCNLLYVYHPLWDN